MIVFRKRLLIWLLKAYLKRWGKRIFLFFVIGVIIFFPLLSLAKYLFTKIPQQENETIGLTGAYRLNDLPMPILQDLSIGLTTIGPDGSIHPGAASSWDIQDNGKTYTFHLKKNMTFSDGTPLTSDQVNYNFSDVTVSRPDPDSITFKLKDVYSPFLVTVARPIFRNGLIGLGNYKVKTFKLNGDFIESFSESAVKNSHNTKTYLFYPTYDAVKTAYILGEISTADDLPSDSILSTNFVTFDNTTVDKQTDYSTLVTLFYNTQDGTLSDKRIREALSYAIPDTFSEGERTYEPFPPSLWAYVDPDTSRKEDLTHAQLLLKASSSSDSASLKLTMQVLPKYQSTAEAIINEWKKLGITTTLQPVDTRPDTFQLFLGDFQVPQDPDQYTLWHSGQDNNITKLDNKRIDLLLEKGRETSKKADRKQIYADFQKYILDEQPATFLYFPYVFNLTRK